MALIKGTNSYVTAAEADTYFADRLDVSGWDVANTTHKEQALVTATGLLDEITWTGTAISESQPLAFPRNGEYFDPKFGTLIILGNSTPNRIINATYELAYHLVNNEGLLDDTGKVLESIQVGNVTLAKPISPNLIPNTVKRLIKPLQMNQGSNVWWRAN